MADPSIVTVSIPRRSVRRRQTQAASSTSRTSSQGAAAASSEAGRKLMRLKKDELVARLLRLQVTEQPTTNDADHRKLTATIQNMRSEMERDQKTIVDLRQQLGLTPPPADDAEPLRRQLADRDQQLELLRRQHDSAAQKLRQRIQELERVDRERSASASDSVHALQQKVQELARQSEKSANDHRDVVQRLEGVIASLRQKLARRERPPPPRPAARSGPRGIRVMSMPMVRPAFH